MITRFTFLLGICLLMVTPGQAQSWKWANRMGGIGGNRHFYQGFAYYEFDQKYIDLATDPKGNVYLLSHDLDSSVDVGSRSLAGYGGNDVFISSFTCDGAFRWSKVIGTNLDTDFCMSIRTDAVGGVYVCGTMTLLAGLGSTGGHLGTDTLIGNTTKTMFIAKWDTAGVYKWLRMPQPDTISYGSSAILSQLLDMDVDAEGASYTLAYLTRGAYAGGGYTVAAPGTHVLRYNAAGQFTGGVPIPISISSGRPSDLRNNFLTYSAALSRFLIVGRGGYFNLAGHSGTVTVGTTPLARDEGYIGSFNASTGALVWLKTSNAPVGVAATEIEDRAKLDERNNIYITGKGSSGSAFNGTTFPVQTGGGAVPFVMKLDAATGNPLWVVSAQYTEGGARSSALAVSNNKVLVGGMVSGKVVFPKDSFSSVYATDSGDCFMLQLDAGTGAIQKTGQLTGPGYTDKIHRIAADRQGNFYYAGRFGGSKFPDTRHTLSIGSNVLTSAGDEDAFVAKWGFNNCNCVLPAPSFTAATPNNKTVQYTYTGTTASIDSLVWDWGDGKRQTVRSSYTAPLSHTFATNGRYNVCVTAYRDTCGNNTYCTRTPLSIGQTPGSLSFTASPNPTGGYLHIGLEVEGTVTVLNLPGQTLMRKNIPSGGGDMDVQSLAAGSYILHVLLKDGRSGYLRITRQ